VQPEAPRGLASAGRRTAVVRSSRKGYHCKDERSRDQRDCQEPHARSFLRSTPAREFSIKVTEASHGGGPAVERIHAAAVHFSFILKHDGSAEDTTPDCFLACWLRAGRSG
jgi:hypothetical protein